MTDQAQSRRLAVIVAVDMAGFSARMEKDESTSAAEVVDLRNNVEKIAHAHAGRLFNSAGDGFMLEFGSSLTAVKAAVELAVKCEPRVRVGVHLGDVQVQPNGDLLGHGVNVAARLMAKSAPGSALVSAAVRQSLHDPIQERLVSRGAMKLDKMNETIEVFALTADKLEAGDGPRSRIQRKLTVILITDMVGYNDQLETDEAGTHERLMSNRNQIVDPHITNHGGRVVKYIADTTLAEFSSAVAAVNCALAILTATEATASNVVESKRVRYRIGINLGEVILEGGEIYGDGVTVVARLQSFAPVGGVAISRAVRDQVEDKVPCSFEDLGDLPVRNSGRRHMQVFVAQPDKPPAPKIH